MSVPRKAYPIFFCILDIFHYYIRIMDTVAILSVSWIQRPILFIYWALFSILYVSWIANPILFILWIHFTILCVSWIPIYFSLEVKTPFTILSVLWIVTELYGTNKIEYGIQDTEK